jgi:predicted lipoprotein with Yx(FWY)xxD motif
MSLRRLTALAVVASAVAVPVAAQAAKTPPTLMVRSSPWGKILETGTGRTVYLWAKDKGDKVNCSGPCLTVWPLVKVSGKPTAGSGVNAKLLGTLKVNGTTEVTYDGHPLYLFISDTKAGVISGEGNKSFGAPWWLVSPSGSAITKKP